MRSLRSSISFASFCFVSTPIRKPWFLREIRKGNPIDLRLADGACDLVALVQKLGGCGPRLGPSLLRRQVSLMYVNPFLNRTLVNHLEFRSARHPLVYFHRHNRRRWNGRSHNILASKCYANDPNHERAKYSQSPSEQENTTLSSVAISSGAAH